MSEKCPNCRAPVGYTESGKMRFDSSQYHMAAAKKLSEISALLGVVESLSKYAQHKLSCDILDHEEIPGGHGYRNKGLPCSCGLSSVLGEDG